MDKEATRKALESMRRDYGRARLGDKLPEDKRPTLTILIGSEPANDNGQEVEDDDDPVVAPTD